MMFIGSKFRDYDPFQLSPLGRLRAAVAWLRGPALVRRWFAGVLCVLCVSSFGMTVVLVVMQPASPEEMTMAVREPGADVASLLRVGPSSSKVIDLPGYDCHPMPTLGLKYLNPMRTGPSVVAIGKDGVVWGPSCVVSYGVAGS